MNAPLAMTDFFISASAILLILFLFVGVPLCLLARWRQSARRLGYPNLRTYLQAIPRTDQEKLVAIEMAMKGLFFCVLGIIAPPLVLIGVFPLYYGSRKLAAAWLGLELLDNGDEKTV